MLHLHDADGLLATVLNWKVLLIACAVSWLSGFLRGFTGFGSALLYVPAMAAIYNPQTAAATLVVIDIIGSAKRTIEARRTCHWHDVLFLTGTALIGAVVGTVALSYEQPILLRYFASAVVLCVLMLITAGWRYSGRPGRILTAVVGLISGFLGGAVAMEGPPAVLFWLGGQNTAAVTRANVMVFIVLTEFMVLLLYACFGLLTAKVLALVVVLLPFFWLSFWLGDRKFHGTTDRVYRLSASLIIGLSAIASLFIQNRVG